MTLDDIRCHASHQVNRRVTVTVRQPQHETIIINLRLRLNVPPSTQLLDSCHGPWTVDASPERRVHYDTPVPYIVSIRLHHDLPVGRHRTARTQLRPDVCDDLTRGNIVNGILTHQPSHQLRRIIILINVWPQSLCHLRPELAVLNTQIRRTPRKLAAPKRHPRHRARRGLRHHAIIIYVDRAPDLTTQREHITNRRLIHELLVKLTNRRLLVRQHDPERATINDGPSVGHGRHSRTGQRT